MDSLMTPEERIALVEKISAKMQDMADEDLRALATEVGAEEVVEDADKAVSKAIADAVMTDEPVVDTGMLTGDRSGLKSFLIKSGREREAKS